MTAYSPLILASASPRRSQLLRDAHVAFEIQPANIPEIPSPGEKPRAFAERMALQKARAVRALFPDRSVLAADTVVSVGNEILGKPEDADDAFRMLRLLSGRVHQVTTGVCLLSLAHEDLRSSTTEVEFASITDQQIRDYVSTAEPMDKAGAYAIQGGAAPWVIRIDGDYNNVVGLPVDVVLAMLRERRLSGRS